MAQLPHFRELDLLRRLGDHRFPGSNDSYLERGHVVGIFFDDTQTIRSTSQVFSVERATRLNDFCASRRAVIRDLESSDTLHMAEVLLGTMLLTGNPSDRSQIFGGW